MIDSVSIFNFYENWQTPKNFLRSPSLTPNSIIKEIIPQYVQDFVQLLSLPNSSFNYDVNNLERRIMTLSMVREALKKMDFQLMVRPPPSPLVGKIIYYKLSTGQILHNTGQVPQKNIYQLRLSLAQPSSIPSYLASSYLKWRRGSTSHFGIVWPSLSYARTLSQNNKAGKILYKR